ncbi:MAG: D-glycero-beta-D-manno-heptose 1-phosphate adenylyltransferase [Lewinella sp.]|nr:D-glycero-beta-D-manno-heptose 1-phosphate adenylyltransferase [Lewinella sp.]
MTLVNDKIMSLTELGFRRAGWRAYDQLTVFTNGVFDLVHPGHLTYLAQARSLGQRLIVAINSDESVARLKGPSRPVMPQAARAQLLASLFFVDGVVIFEEDTPLAAIQQLCPEILVKGGDYTLESIVGAKETLARGGKVEVLPFLEGYSTTGLIAQLNA